MTWDQLEREIDTHRLSTFHKRCATLRIPKDKHLGRPKRLANLCGTGGMVNAHEDIQSALLGVFFEPVHRFLGREGTLHGDETVGAEGRRRERKQRRQHDAQ